MIDKLDTGKFDLDRLLSKLGNKKRVDKTFDFTKFVQLADAIEHIFGLTTTPEKLIEYLVRADMANQIVESDYGKDWWQECSQDDKKRDDDFMRTCGNCVHFNGETCGNLARIGNPLKPTAECGACEDYHSEFPKLTPIREKEKSGKKRRKN